MRAPAGLDAASIAEKADPDLLVPTINVETQESGLRMTLREWAEYFAQPPGSCPAGRISRYPLLNVVSLSLAGTPLQVNSSVLVIDIVWHAPLHRQILSEGVMSGRGKWCFCWSMAWAVLLVA